MDLVLFEHALQSVARISRIVSIPSCNLIQVGICGTGRQSITKLVCLLFNIKFFKLVMTENFNTKDWHQTIKAFLKEAGGYGKHCVFHLKDQDFVFDGILDDLYSLLKTGQIPFLYSLEENQEILDLVRNSIQESEESINISGDSESILLYYQKRCKENLHVVMSLNKNGSKFRKALRSYPSLLKFCEINYIKDWPQDSFTSIATAWIQNLQISKEIKPVVAKLFNKFHKEPQTINNGVCITTGAFLEFVRLFVNLINFKQKKITDVKQKYLTALEKLSFAAQQISEMQKSLADYQPQLEAMTEAATEMAKQIEKETMEVEKVSNLVKKDEEMANEQAAAAQVLKLDCEADLAQAIPILEDAISALNTLKPTDITLVKSMKNPPDAIKLVMAAVCVIKDVKPDRIPDPSTGRKTIDYWGPSKRILGDMNFLQTLKDFDKDNIKPEIMVKIRKDYLPHKDFKPHVVAKASSAAEGLCKWIIAMDMYDKVAKEVAPKKEKLEKAEREYAVTLSILNEKKEQVARIEEKLADLNATLKEATRKQRKLQRDVDICKRKLERAQKLIGGLSEEKIRWTNAVELLKEQYERLPGDIILSSAGIAYLGSFRKDNRKKLFDTWLSYVSQNGIPYTENYNFADIFKKEADYDRWHLNGLPVDNFFVENGIIAKFSKRWPLFIDPQKQANTWIKLNEKQNGIKVTKFTCPNYLNIMKMCITTGVPLLIENVEETMEPFLVNLITRNIYTENDNKLLNLGGTVVHFNENFFLYMTTNIKYPKFCPELYDKLKIVDFGMNRESLEDQLLTCVVEVEKPTLKRVKKNLNTERKRNKDTLYNIEEKILKTLSESKTDILEDEAALQILDESKILSREIQQKQENLKKTEQFLNTFREGYKTVGKHATSLYFTTYQLTKLNHMYQFSYNWFIETYSESIQKAHKYKVLLLRRKSLIATLNYELYCKICRSIFEKDKLFFSFLLVTNILLAQNKITSEELHFFTKCKSIEKASGGPDWLPKKIWCKLTKLIKLEPFKDFLNVFMKLEVTFKKIFNSSLPEQETLPEPVKSSFQKLLIISLLRPDRLHNCIYNFVESELGSQFVKPLFFDITHSYNESYILSPLIFIMKPGTDSVKALINFAKAKNFFNKLILASTKIGEEEELEALINKGKILGSWICLQNCHLLKSWLPLLDLQLEEIDYSNTHENFRLWLTTNETLDFPISLLERSVKITKEAPRGIRNQLSKSFLDDPINSPVFYTNCPGKHEIFIRLLYCSVFLHCVLQERKRFGWYGWRIPYEFHENDLIISIQELQHIIRNRENPFDEMTHLIESCTYGGYITEGNDCKLLKVIVSDYLNRKSALNSGDTFLNWFSIGIPLKSDHQDCLSHIMKLSGVDKTDIFGLHENYEVIRGLNESDPLFGSINITFNEIIEEKKSTNVSEVINTLQNQLPSELKIEEVSENFIINSILQQEFNLCNKLLINIKASLQNIQKVIEGEAVMSDELEATCISILENKIPLKWSKQILISSNCLSALKNHLNERVNYFKNFKYSPTQHIWLESFFNPKALLIATKLEFIKKKSILVDEIEFQLTSAPRDSQFNNGVLVSGLNIIGASWNKTTERLEELQSKITHQEIPLVYFTFTEFSQKMFQCPLYKHIKLSHENSSNFVLPLLIATEQSKEHWIRRRVAILCQI